MSLIFCIEAISKDDPGQWRVLLFIPHLAVQAVCFQQFIVRAVFSDTALAHHIYSVTAFHRRQAVGDDDAGKVRIKAENSVLDARFRYGVEIACRLIQDQQLRIAEQRAGNSEPLALPAGEVCAIFVQGRFIAQRQLFNKL